MASRHCVRFPSLYGRSGVRLAGPILLVVAMYWFAAPTVMAQSYQGDNAGSHAVVRVSHVSQADANQLAAALDVWDVDHAQGVLTAWVSPEQLADLRARGYAVIVDPELNRRAAQGMVRAAAGESSSGIPGFTCYRTVEETYTDLAELAAANPELAEWVDIGDSWEKEAGRGGHDIYALQLTNRAVSGPKPKFILMAAIHAREYTTAELATRFAQRLVAAYGTDPDITWLLDYHELHLIPQANPDGRKRAEAGALWRKNVNDTETAFCPGNAHGVDLNRNSSFRWNQCDGFGCSSSFPCDLTYRGPAAASEPETRVIQEYVTSLLPDRRGSADTDAAPADTEGLFISLHSYSELILFPWGWSPRTSPNFTALQTLGRKFGYFTGYEVCQAGASGCLYQTDGTTDDWSYGTLGVASFTFELGTWFFESCTYFEDDIVGKGMDALLYAFKAARRPYQTPAGPEITQLDVTEPHGPSASLLLTAVADDTRYAANSRLPLEEPVQEIVAARYSVDAPSWMTGTVTYTMNAPAVISSTAMLTATVDTSDWRAGRHILFVEAQDGSGAWGVPTAVFVDKPRPVILVAAGEPVQAGLPGTQLDYALTVTNTGTVTGTFAVEIVTHTLASDAAWAVTVNPDGELTVPPGASLPISVTIGVPGAAQRNESLLVQVLLLSAADAARLDSMELMAEVQGIDMHLPLIVTVGSAGAGK